MKNNTETYGVLSFGKLFITFMSLTVRAAPGMSAVSAVTAVLHSLSWGALVLFKQNLFDAASDLYAGTAAVNVMITALLALTLGIVAQQVLNGVGNYWNYPIEAKVEEKLQQQVHLKLARLDPLVFEDTNMLDDINKAEQGTPQVYHFVSAMFTLMFFYLPYFTFIGWYLYQREPRLLLALLFVFVPTVLSQMIRIKIFAKLEDRSAPWRRKSEYYEECLTDRKIIKETRMLGANQYFQTLYQDSLEHTNELKWQAEKRGSLWELLMKGLTVAGYFGILWLLIDSLIKGSITVGVFGAVFSSIGTIFDMMEEIVCSRIGTLTQKFGTVINYNRFLELPERSQKHGADSAVYMGERERQESSEYAGRQNGDIRLDHVEFIYPQAKDAALRDLNLHFREGETVAIVGANGSGKSTLVRLLAGIYRPTKGSVYYGAQNLEHINSQEIYQGSTAVFQKFQNYQVTLGENTAISRTEPEPRVISRSLGGQEIHLKQDPEKLRMAWAQANVDPHSDLFPDGAETVLSREFGGTDLSGGQWQKIAIARGFYRDGVRLFLDEPTAAIDPVEETRMYEQFGKAAEDKTAFIVTHRLGSVKYADRILVMNRGKVAGFDSHEKLLKECSIYRELWQSQVKYYKESAYS